MDAEFILVSIDTTIAMKQQELAEYGMAVSIFLKQQELAERQFFLLKMANFGQSAKGGPFAKISKLAIFLAQL